MSTNKRVSFKGLRILTYTILIKAVIDAGMLVSRLLESDVLLTITHAAEFINITACVLCLGGAVALSSLFVHVHRMMVVMLILKCLTLLMISVDLFLIISNNDPATGGPGFVALILFIAGRLIAGAALFLLMKGFGEILRKEGDNDAAAAMEKTGVIYLICNSIGAILAALVGAIAGAALFVMAIVFDVLCVILETMMFQKTSAAAFRIWKSRASIAAY